MSDAPKKKMPRGGLGMFLISLRGGLQKRPISLRGGPQLDRSTIVGWSIFPTHPSFILKKNHFRVPLEKLDCRVGGGPGCLAEIAAGWSEIFSHITAGYP